MKTLKKSLSASGEGDCKDWDKYVSAISFLTSLHHVRLRAVPRSSSYSGGKRGTWMSYKSVCTVAHSVMESSHSSIYCSAGAGGTKENKNWIMQKVRRHGGHL